MEGIGGLTIISESGGEGRGARGEGSKSSHEISPRTRLRRLKRRPLVGYEESTPFGGSFLGKGQKSDINH